MLLTNKVRSKYNAIKTEVNGITFDSKKEASIYNELLLRGKAGEIHSLSLQVPIYFKCNGVFCFKYIADFKYYDNKLGDWVILDAKGILTDVYRLKKKLIEAQFGIKIIER